MFRGRLRTVLWVSLTVVLVLSVVVGLRVQYIRSPQYSVEQLARAATAKDWEGVQQYVDVDAVVGDQVDKLIDGTAGGDDSLLGEFGDWLGESTKPEAIRLAKGALRAAIQAGPNRPGTAVDLAGLFAKQSVKSVTFPGDEALVIAESRFGDKRVVRVTLRMKRMDNYWRVIAVEGFQFLRRDGAGLVPLLLTPQRQTATAANAEATRSVSAPILSPDLSPKYLVTVGTRW